MKKIFLLLILFQLFSWIARAQHETHLICGTVLDSATMAQIDKMESIVQQRIAFLARENTPESAVTIPVKIHVIRRNDGSVEHSVDVTGLIGNLNDKFSGTGFSFEQCGETNYINNTALFYFDYAEESALMAAAYLPDVVNLYLPESVTVSNKEIGGYAYNPLQYKPDVIVLAAGEVNYSTLPHEFGHYFGLLHTHGNIPSCPSTPGTDELVERCNCTTAGDRVCDTPADPGLSYGSACGSSLVQYNGNGQCQYIGPPSIHDANGVPFNPDLDNIMSYGIEACKTQFTEGQKARMVAQYQMYRKYLSCSASSCGTPYSVYASQITNTTAKINWVAASSAIRHEFEMKAGNGPWMPVNAGPYTDENYIYLNNLSQSTTYKCRARSICAYGLESGWKESSSFTTLALCNAPTNLSTNLLGTDYVQFSWNAVSGALSYNIEVRHIGSSVWYKSVTTSGSSFLFPATNEANITSDRGLGSNTPYEWRIRTYCGNNMYSNWSTPVPFTTAPTACNSPLPAELEVLSISPYSVTIKCNTDAYSYKFRRHPGGFQNNLNFYKTYTFSADPCTTYEIECMVRCENGGETSRYSAPLIVTTPGCTNCTLPAVTTTAATTSNSATLNWSYVSGALNYSIQWQTGNGPWTDLSPAPFWGSSTTVYNLTPGAHKWRIRTNCVGGQSTGWSAAIPVNINGSACETVAIRGLKVHNLGQTSAKLVWYPPGAGTYNYTIWYRPSGGTWTQTAANDTVKIITGLSPGTTYYWQVQINCPGNQTGPWTTGLNFATLPLSTLSASPASQNVSYNAGSTAISVNANIEWLATVSSTGNWLKICPFSGVNNGTITATFPANTGSSSRTATITITGGGITRTVTITQSANTNPNCSNDNEPANNSPSTAPALSLNTDKQSQIGTSSDVDYWKFSLPASMNVAITLKTLPGDYDIILYDANQTQLGLSVLGGNVDETIVKNNLPAGTYTLKIYGYNGAYSNTQCYTLKVATTAANNLTVSPTTKTVGAGAGSETLTVGANVSWTVTDNASWLNVSPASGTNNGTLTATFTANTSASPRTATITISGGGLTQTANITQAGYTNPNCSNDSEPANNARSTAPTIALNTDKQSQIGTSSDVDYWKFSLSSTQTAAINLSTLPYDYDMILQNASGVQLAISENANTNSESITQTLAAGTYFVKVYGYNGAYSASQCYTLRVVASASNSLAITPASQNVPASSGTATFAISSNVAWTASDNAGWLSVSPGSGSNNSTLVAAFSANTSSSARTATITISGGGLTQTATVTQAGASTGCASPVNLQTGSITQNTATLTWNSVTGATSYQVQFFFNGNWLNIGSPTPNLSMGIYGLIPNNSYQWRVIALCGNGQQSSPSSTVSFSTPYATNCTGGTQSPAYALNPSANWQYQSNLWGGHYCLVNVQAGMFYTFSFCSSDGASISFDGQISIKSTNDVLYAYNDDYCGLAPKLVWQASFTGQIRVLLTKYTCQTQQSNSTLAYKASSSNFNGGGEPEDRSASLNWAPVPASAFANALSQGNSSFDQVEKPAPELEVFPNPASGAFAIVVKNGNVTKTEVIDQLGQQVWQSFNPDESVENDIILDADASNWLPGIYFVRVRFKDGDYLTRKILINR
ncbi:MAG: T9SS type A sorting domain-containing protein [Lewinellaceae bacterium]|nr:T9SS type A sorting domain-containing protein [Lewinellaceae bacterium]